MYRVLCGELSLFELCFVCACVRLCVLLLFCVRVFVFYCAMVYGVFLCSLCLCFVVCAAALVLNRVFGCFACGLLCDAVWYFCPCFCVLVCVCVRVAVLSVCVFVCEVLYDAVWFVFFCFDFVCLCVVYALL